MDTRQRFRLNVHYLDVFTITIVFSRLLQYLAPEWPVFRGQPLSIWLCLFGSGLGLLVALRTRRSEGNFPASKLSFALLAVLSLAWVTTLILMRFHGDLFSPYSIVLPAVAFALLLSWPSPKVFRQSLFNYLSIVLFAILITFAAHWLGLHQFRADFATRLPISFMGINYRWESFFGDANNAGTAMDILVLIGIYHGRRWGWGCAGLSTFLLVLTQSRTAIAALAVGLALYCVLRMERRSRFSKLLRLLIAVVAVAIVLLIVIRDPSLNGRVPIWGEFLHLGWTSPLFGVGTSGVEAVVPQMTGFAQDAHSVFFDPFVRYGVFAAGTALICLVLMSFACLRHPKLEGGFLASLAITMLLCFFTYTTFSWAYLTLFIWPFLISSFLASDLSATCRSVARPFRSRMASPL